MKLVELMKEIEHFIKVNQVVFGEFVIIFKQGKIFELQMTKKEQK
jgi:hypothetical protein